ncbi:MAG: tRNA dihydrouridine synthase DusB [Alphaproteobacteria bacterium]|nr:tRNA dihydrouridine synthase DusB [Alphaproteobacteria bacterium]
MKKLEFNSRVFLAPMAGITDKPMRRLVSEFGEGNIVSEMAAVNAIQWRNPKTYRLIDVRDEPYPVIVQLVGGDPDLFADAVKMAEDLGAFSIDINMGCPVKKIVNNQSGSYLMKDLKLASRIIETAVKNTRLNVSVKFRAGWDKSHINAVEFAKMCEDSGAAYVTVHGRTRSEFYSGQADWNIIRQVKANVKIPVIGNGDITTPQQAKERLTQTGVDGVMIARGVLGSPWLIAHTHHYLETGEQCPPPTISIIKQVLLKHLQYLIEYYGESMALQISRKYVCWYCKGLREAKKFREIYMHICNYQQAYQAINNYFDECAIQEDE